VANTDVKDILKANLPELKAALSSLGLNVNTLDVSIMSGYIGSGLSDSSSNRFSEWEGSAIRPDAEETLENSTALNGVDGYLNFLA
jgi:flagellar hook-length control protein FliK